jgi:hypothetical protein
MAEFLVAFRVLAVSRIYLAVGSMPRISKTNGAKIWPFRAPRKVFKTPRNFRS